MRTIITVALILLGFSCSKDCIPQNTLLDQTKEEHFPETVFKKLDFDFGGGDILLDINNGYVVAGQGSLNSRDIHLLKLNNKFEKTNDVPLKSNFLFSQQTLIKNSKNQYILLNSNRDSKTLIGMDASGFVFSQIEIDKSNSFIRAECITDIPGGDILVLSTGYSTNGSLYPTSYSVKRLKPTGEIVWNKDFNEPKIKASTIKLSNSKDAVYLIGETHYLPFTEHELKFKILSLDGTIVLEKTIKNGDLVGSIPDSDIIQNKESGFIVCYNKDAKECSIRDFYISSLDKDGNELWNQRYSLINNQVSCEKIIQTQDGSFIVLFNVYKKSNDVALMKITNSGNILWFKTYGHKSIAETSTEILEKPNGNLVILGNTNSKDSDSVFNAIFLETDSNGIPVK